MCPQLYQSEPCTKEDHCQLSMDNTITNITPKKVVKFGSKFLENLRLA